MNRKTARLLTNLPAGRQSWKSPDSPAVCYALISEGVICAILDLTAIGQNLDAERWYGGLLNQLGQQVGLEDELDDAAASLRRR